MPRKETVQPSATAQAQQEAAAEGIESYELPKTLVTRIAKSAVSFASKPHFYLAIFITSILVSFANTDTRKLEAAKGHGDCTCTRVDSLHQLPRFVTLRLSLS